MPMTVDAVEMREGRPRGEVAAVVGVIDADRGRIRAGDGAAP